MKKVIVMLLAAVFAAAGLGTQRAAAQDAQAPAAAPAKQARWHGTIIRMATDGASMDVRRQGIDKKIYFDSSTKWTEGTKTIEMSEVKEGADVICLGTLDEKGLFHATRIDLRKR